MIPHYIAVVTVRRLLHSYALGNPGLAVLSDSAPCADSRVFMRKWVCPA